MTAIADNNRRIARNTLFLYMRMLLIMAVSLFTFRMLLKELGETDYGTYNVVGGVVILFSFLNSAMTQSTQRFLSYYIGKKDNDMLQRVFSMSVNVHIVIAIAALLLAETIGLWFLNTYMQFPPGSMSSVNIVYQCSVCIFIIRIMTVPYQAAIISHERMAFYAYLSIAEVLMNLSVVFALGFFSSKRLNAYAIMLIVVALITFSLSHWYNARHFKACRYRFSADHALFKELSGFSGWNMLGGIGNVGASQGVNIIFNLFCGVGLNAAMGVANQVGAAVASFVGNFQTAFNPQIIKLYASNDQSLFLSLVFRASRFSYLLIFVIGFPIMICCGPLLETWLTDVPVYAVPFTQFIIAFAMIDAMSGPLWTAAQASGRIKKYMLLIATMIFTNVPAAYFILWLGWSPIWVMGYKVAMNLLIHFTRIFYLHWLIQFPSGFYLRKVMLPITLFTLLCIPLPIYMIHPSLTIWGYILIMIFTSCECATLGYFILLNKSERQFIRQKTKAVLTKCI